MTEQEELIMLRVLVEKQKREIEEKDETIRRQFVRLQNVPNVEPMEVIIQTSILRKQPYL